MTRRKVKKPPFWLLIGARKLVFSGTNQKPERRRPFGTGLVRHCPQGLFSMASDRGQNRYSDFVALETLLRFENCSSSHCLLSSWRRFHVFESSHPSFHRSVFFGALSVVFLASVPCLRVVASLVSAYRILRGTAVSSLRHFYVFVSSGCA